jgi:subtilisin family serine protease
MPGMMALYQSPKNGMRLFTQTWALSFLFLLLLRVAALDLSDRTIPEYVSHAMAHSNTLRGSSSDDFLSEVSPDSWLHWEHRKLNIFRPNNASLVNRTWIVVLNSNSVSPIQSVLKRKVIRVNVALLSLVVKGISQATLGWLLRRPDVVLVEEVRKFEFTMHGCCCLKVQLTAFRLSFLQNKPVRAMVDQKLTSGQPWGLDRVDGTVDSKYTYTWSGKGVQVYVFDTGIMATHDEFSGGRARCGLNVIKNETCDDLKGHGTHVAGTVGGKTYGLAKSVEFINVKVLDKNGNGNVADVLVGLDYVLQQKTAQPNAPMIIHLSLGSANSTTFNAAVNKVVDGGIFVVAAAGNSGVDACSTSPASAEKGITVGGLDVGDTLPSWSNFGPCVDLYAPAVNILSATYDAVDTKKTAYRSGTSMAVPHVVGVLALYLEWNPSLLPSTIQTLISADSIRNVIANALNLTNNRLLTSTAVRSYPPLAPTASPSGVGEVGQAQCRTFLLPCTTSADCCLKACHEFTLLPILGRRCFLYD